MPSIKKRGCVEQTTKKYTERPGPPYPAQECAGTTQLGNDEQQYESVPNKNGVYRWVKIKTKKTTKKKATSTKAKSNKKKVTTSGTTKRKASKPKTTTTTTHVTSKPKASTKKSSTKSSSSSKKIKSKEFFKYKMVYEVLIYDPDQESRSFDEINYTNISENIDSKGIQKLKKYIEQDLTDSDDIWELSDLKIKSFKTKGIGKEMIITFKSPKFYENKYNIDPLSAWDDGGGEGTVKLGWHEYGVYIELKDMEVE